MATWSLLQNLTEFDFNSVATDGVDIFFVQYGGGLNYQVFKYDVSADSISQISNDSSWGVTAVVASNAAGGLTVSALQWFKGHLYVAVWASGDSNPLRIYRYSGSGTAWTNVLAANVGSQYFGLFCTEDHLIAGPSSHVDLIMDWAQYSSDGSSWSAATVGNVPAAYAGNRQVAGGIIRQGTDKIVFTDKSDNSADYNYRWFEWNGAGTFTITHYTEWLSGGPWTPSEAWLRDPPIFCDVFFWYLDSDSIWKYASTLGDAWATPGNHLQGGSEIFPAISIGFTEQIGDCDGDFVLLTGSNWGSPETVGSGGISHAIKLDEGNGYLFAAVGAQAGIYGRSEPFTNPNPRFYQGINSLIYRSDLPAGVNGIEIDSLAVCNDRVAIGSWNANSVMIAQAEPGDDYASWTDLTGSHPQNPIKALRRVE